MKRLRNKLNTQIELTSLLDVIFIVLMVVICSQQMTTKAAQQDAEDEISKAQRAQIEAQNERAEAEAEKKLFEEHMETYEEINTQMSVVTVYADYTPSDPSERTLSLMVDTESSSKIIMTPGTEKVSWAKLESQLTDAVEKANAAGKPVIISVNRDRILYRDESRLTSLVDDLFRRYDNIYYKQTASEGSSEGGS